MSLPELVQAVQVAADAASSGDPASRAQLQLAIHKLRLGAETPTESIVRVFYQPVQNAALRVAVDMGLPQIIAERNGEAITATELAMETGSSPLLIVRIMRILIAMGMCDEVGEETYRANAVANGLASASFIGGTKFLFDSFFPTAAKMAEYFQQSGFKNPENDYPFHYAFQENFWEKLAKKPIDHADMMAYMAGRRLGQLRWLDIYPAATELEGVLNGVPSDVLLVDIGGNQGHDIKAFRERQPNLPGRLILEDLPEVVEKINPPLQGIEIVPYNFFMPQPIEGAAVYFFRAICHGWSDDECHKFLSNTVGVMGRGSRLLINDYILPNTGVALFPASLDFMMMSLSGGVERTERQWRTLLDSVGLEIVKIWSVTQEVEAVIETRLRCDKYSD